MGTEFLFAVVDVLKWILVMTAHLRITHSKLGELYGTLILSQNSNIKNKSRKTKKKKGGWGGEIEPLSFKSRLLSEGGLCGIQTVSQ